MALELTERDRRVIATIEQIREANHACTAAAVAATLKISKAYMSDVMHEMIENGLLTFNPEVAGSLRLTDAARTELFPAAAGRHVCDHPDCDWPTRAAVDMHKRKVH